MKENLREQLKLYGITDDAWVGKKYASLELQVRDALEGGITMLQLRDKKTDEKHFVEEASRIKELTDAYRVPLIINDNVEVAKAVGADGVHLGQDDMKIADARRILGDDAIIGISAHNVKEAIAAERSGADYLGVGAVFGTTTKSDAKPLSAGELRRICEAVSIPVVAIGGITRDNIKRLCGTGISGTAIVSGIFAQEDIVEAVERLIREVDGMLSDTEKLQGILNQLEPVLKQKRGLIFDLDGTLLDSMPMWGSLDVTYMGRYGIVPEADFHHKVATMTLMKAAEYMEEYYRIPRSAKEIFGDIQEMVYEEYAYHLQLKPLALELIAVLWAKGYKIVVATANEQELVQPVLTRTGLSPYVEGLVSCTMVGAGKEKPDVYLKACEMMHIDPSQGVVFEDSLRAIKTAKDAGFSTVAVYDSVVEGYWENICSLTDAQIVFGTMGWSDEDGKER